MSTDDLKITKPEAATVNELFEVAIATEQAAHRAYQHLAQMFASEPEVKAFWERYAAEETIHANWLKGLRERLSAAELTAPADKEIMGMLRGLHEMPVDELLNKIGNLDEAFRLVHNMENSEINVVFSFLVDHFGADENTQVFIKSQLKNHTNHLLVDLPSSFGVLVRVRLSRLHIRSIWL